MKGESNMNNYYKFTKLTEDGESFQYFNSLSNKFLKNILDDSFNYIDSTINNYANVFKNIFNGYDYNEFYYSCKSLSEELNNIKIILNILKDRSNND